MLLDGSLQAGQQVVVTVLRFGPGPPVFGFGITLSGFVAIGQDIADLDRKPGTSTLWCAVASVHSGRRSGYRAGPGQR